MLKVGNKRNHNKVITVVKGSLFRTPMRSSRKGLHWARSLYACYLYLKEGKSLDHLFSIALFPPKARPSFLRSSIVSLYADWLLKVLNGWFSKGKAKILCNCVARRHL